MADRSNNNSWLPPAFKKLHWNDIVLTVMLIVTVLILVYVMSFEQTCNECIEQGLCSVNIDPYEKLNYDNITKVNAAADVLIPINLSPNNGG